MSARDQKVSTGANKEANKTNKSDVGDASWRHGGVEAWDALGIVQTIQYCYAYGLFALPTAKIYHC